MPGVRPLALSVYAMDAEDLKQNIRRRLFAAQFKAGDPLRSSSEHFMTCPTCEGRGKVCHESSVRGVHVAALDDCVRCEGRGFIERTA
jgi:DnaJ-class molecular chaperone